MFGALNETDSWVPGNAMLDETVRLTSLDSLKWNSHRPSSCRRHEDAVFAPFA